MTQEGIVQAAAGPEIAGNAYGKITCGWATWGSGRIGYQFRQVNTLEEALTHGRLTWRSAINGEWFVILGATPLPLAWEKRDG